MSYILDVCGISKRFGNTPVLEDISFTLSKGETLAIIGASGSGKTTLLRCLNFLETPDKGTITVSGKRLFDANDSETHNEAEKRMKRLHFGLVFQSFNLFPQHTVLKNATLACELLAKERPDYKENKKEILLRIDENARRILDSVGLSDKLGNYPHQLSGGQQQRVAIARALALEPDILCFDEPTSALDPELTGEVLKVYPGSSRTEYHHDYCHTHEMPFAREVANTVLFMDGGVVVERGAPEEVFGHPKEEGTRQFLERYFEG
jgi:polar amino acid transport system ATP-binding protein